MTTVSSAASKPLALDQKSVNPGCLAKISLVLIGLALALGLSELMARLFFPSPGHARFIPDPVVGFRHAPDQEVWVTNEAREFGVWFTTNSQGDPDQERSFDKPAGVYRIAVMGDSMVEAAQVRREERFASLLEAQLTEWIQTRPGPIRQVEVLNFGVASYGTAQEWLYYQSHVRRYKPDLVLLVVFPGNDIRNNSFHLEVEQASRREIMPFFYLNEAGELTLKDRQFYDNAVKAYAGSTDKPAGWRGVYESIRDNVRLIEVLHRGYTAIRMRAAVKDELAAYEASAVQLELDLFNPQVHATSIEWQQAWQITTAILQRFAGEVAADGAGLHVAIFPGVWEINQESRDAFIQGDDSQYDWYLPNRSMEAVVARLGLSYTNLLPASEQAFFERGELTHFVKDGHYTPAGHRLVAAELLPVLKSYLSK